MLYNKCTPCGCFRAARSGYACAPCGCFGAAQSGYAWQCTLFDIDAAECNHFEINAAECGHFDSDTAQCGCFKNNKNNSFGKKMQPLTKKFNYIIFLSNNLALYFIDDDFVKKMLYIAFILRRGFYYHHDFVALLSKLHKRLKIFNFAIIFILCLHFFSPNIMLIKHF